jgi:nicotinamide-nucleotide amidase
VDEKIADCFGHENPYLGIYSKADGIHLRMIARARNLDTARALIVPMEEAILSQLAPYVWGYDEETPAQAVGRLLKARGLTLASMESGTGGYLANSLTDGPDSATYFKGGVVASSPAVLLADSVLTDVLRQHGLVSRESAAAMAQAVRAHMGADVGLGITGVPGPEAIEGQPIGLAYFAMATHDTVRVEETRVAPRRITLKRRVSNAALIALSKVLQGAQQGAAYHW